MRSLFHANHAVLPVKRHAGITVVLSGPNSRSWRIASPWRFSRSTAWRHFPGRPVTMSLCLQPSTPPTLMRLSYPGGPTGSGADEIRFQAGLTGTIQVAGSWPFLVGDLTITGPGANLLTIRATGIERLNRVFTVFDTVVISGLTITGGKATSLEVSSGDSGGGILNHGNLTLQNCVISDNYALHAGGGIFNERNGILTVLNSTIEGNSAGHGGGIYNNGFNPFRDTHGPLQREADGVLRHPWFDNAYATINVQNCTLSNNTSLFQGGAIENNGGTLSVQNSTLSGNRTAGCGEAYIAPLSSKAALMVP